MYGVEEETSGHGGLASQAPGGNRFFTDTLGITPRGQTPQIAGAGPTTPLAYTSLGRMTAAPQPGATDVTRDHSHSMPHWSDILNFHNSPAPYILIMVLVLVGWLHLGFSVGRGRRGAAVRIG